MGVAYREERETRTRPKYPEAPGKVAYYDNIITQLNSYKTSATSAKGSMDKSYYKTSTENPDAEGPYYDTEYLTHKDNWFSKNTTLINSLNSYINIIGNRINDAIALRDDWAAKALETEEYEVVTYVPVDEG